MEVLYQDRHLLVSNKPAGVLSQPDGTQDPSLVELARNEILRQLEAEGGGEGRNPYVTPTHRLDRPVSGLLLMARTSKAASRLTGQFRSEAVRKVYVAVASRRLSIDHAEVTLWLKKDRQKNRVDFRSREFSNAQRSRTVVQVVSRTRDRTLVSLFPKTGRTHQLRVVMAHLSAPIMGDLRYGADTGLGHYIALHAVTLRFQHPITGAMLAVTAPIPEIWRTAFPEFFGPGCPAECFCTGRFEGCARG